MKSKGLGHMHGELETLIASGYEARRAGRSNDAKARFSDAVALSREAGDETALAKSLCGLGQIERDLGDRSAAVRCYREAVRIYEELPEPLRLAHAVRHLADILRGSDAFQEALEPYQQALAIYRQHKETPPLDLANTLRGFALLSESTGETERAKAMWREARNLYEAAGTPVGVKESEARLAALSR